ncbi:MAG: long-chain fatty acid--CoA ligase [Vicinamibacterales bacterium]|jgi:long-chain acyl-CoA synthetase|nr:long-chain fatty acid--CoA ligase [Acidobacteriota bacterium]MDP7294999.1 long-chain fatty acid--CoA ligase [Vicinamibacterales bacterium]MDP7472034.1 long-chain fatty acid--CoA ligase [Vicinamibacterales bacterium]MDP7671672.1 long-chain fatty acid--CoA ligase [Vicinamibacterales bacterium]HJO39179.1 long-chain fatty acid--CoA ligase [Vicinamibacterales bacterium]
MTEPDVRTLADLPFHVSGRFPKPILLQRCRVDGTDDLSSKEVFEGVRDLSLGLGALGVGAGDKIALVSESRPEWTMTDLAILTAGAITVPLYPTLGAEQMRGILADSGARFAVVSDEEQAAKLRSVRQSLPSLEAVAVIDRGEGDTPGAGATEMRLSVVAARGHKRLMTEGGLGRRYREVTAGLDPDAVATIIYTSGTTGEPKGVMLTHANILSNVKASRQVIPMTSEDWALSFLPLSHSLERTVMYLYLYDGVTVAFAESLETIGRDLQAVAPTIMTGVPRVFEKVQARVLESVAQAPALRRKIFGWALGVGWGRASRELAGQSVPWPLRLQNRLADRLVFGKIRARTGGNLRLIVSGGAPLGRAPAEFFCAIGMPIAEGYGLTETAPVLTVNPREAVRIGTVGPAIPGVELKVAADGELLARGPNIMPGYFGKPEATAEVIKDGWFHTGDIAEIDADGYVTITDRKKDLLVTSGGKNIAPQPVEGRLRASPLVAEAVLIGDRRQYVTALLLPDRALLEEQVRRAGGEAPALEVLVERDDVRAWYQAVVDEVNKSLAGFEQIKRFAVLAAEFSIAGGELTPTMKVRRRVVTERWQAVIDGLYS